ncbi:MAG TPA: HlyD family efflux transporter periplasmic adaptor subunit, partial [Tepidisphaeraceae bacterium]
MRVHQQLTILAACLSLAAASTLRADAPPATAAAGAAASQPADTVAVAKGTIVASVEVEGYFEPTDPLEVRIRPESYQGDLKIKSAAAHGASVRQGEVILAIDSTNLSKQIAEAENALVTAKANQTKAESDDYLGEQGDALALQQARDELANAEAGLKWWEDVDGKQMLTMAEMGTRNARNNVEDQSDELDQLKKMYKTEELTNATADIVVKRAVRSLEQSKIMQLMAELREGKTKAFDYNVARTKVAFNIEMEKQQLAQLKAAQEQQRTLRKTAVASARMAADRAQTKVDELHGDLDALTVHAPFDGVVYYGQLTNGAWQNTNPKLLRTGEKAAPGQVLITLVRPGKERIVADIPENRLSWIEPGTSEARVIPTALPDAAGNAKLADISPTGGAREGAPGFQAHF